MITNKPEWIQVFNSFINTNQITHINMLVFGKDCHAPFENKDDKYFVIHLACGQSFRVAHNDPDATEVLKKLGFNLK